MIIMKCKAFRDIKLKDGKMIEKGTMLSVVPVRDNPSACRVVVLESNWSADEVLTLRWTSVKKAPSEKTLENWIFDISRPKAVNGCEVDPDGYTCDGYPSWLLALGMI